MNCPTCGSDKNRKARETRGIFPDSNANRRQCTSCGRKWKVYEKNPKLLYFDIEVAPTLAYTWGAHKQYIRPDKIVEDFFILGWAAKWVCDSYMHSYVLRPSEAKKGKDKRILKPLWDMFNRADVIIGHNSDNFDIKKMNWRWMVNDFKPPKPYKTVDTLKELRKIAAPASRSLDYATKRLSLNGKMKHDPELFYKCKEGDGEALRELRKYNEIDVLEGEGLYLKLRPWMKTHPNMGLYFEGTDERCRNCGSTDIDIDFKNLVHTPANSYACWTCVNCGAHGRTPYSARYEQGYEGETKEERQDRAANNRIKRESLMR